MNSLTWKMTGDRSARGLLFASLAVNLFLLGVVTAVYLNPVLNDPAKVDRSAAGRIERIAVTLAPADAEVLRTEFRSQAAAIEAARDKVDAAQETVRDALGAEPFDGAALRAAMALSREARRTFFTGLNDVVASAAAGMSPDGRARLADRSSRRGR